MARLSDFPKEERSHLLSLACPRFASKPWVVGPPLKERRIALISTAGLHRRGDRAFSVGSVDYRIISSTISANDLIMSHISTNFDRTGFQQDLNVVFPIDRLRELAADNVIGSIAEFHYSFMGATEPTLMESTARSLARVMKSDKVDSVLLVPV